MNRKIFAFSFTIFGLFLFSSQLIAQSAQDKIEDAFQELESDELTLRFFNALDGKPIEKGTVAIAGIGEYQTDYEGKVLFPAGEDGVVNVTFRKPGFIESVFPIEIMAGTIFFNRFSVSPALPLGNVRIVLDWSQEPRDLDAHLVKGDQYHISFRNMKVSRDGVARLDRDDVNGNGPETITVKDIDDSAEYIFVVHNYSDRHRDRCSNLSKSKGCVKVYGDNRLLGLFQVPRDIAGNYWHVFSIINGDIREVNKIQKNDPGI